MKIYCISWKDERWAADEKALKNINQLINQEKIQMSKIQKILDAGDFDRYEECEEILKDALAVGTEKDAGIDVFHAIDDVLCEDFRNPIPTGMVGIDNLMDGCLSK